MAALADSLRDEIRQLEQALSEKRARLAAEEAKVQNGDRQNQTREEALAEWRKLIEEIGRRSVGGNAVEGNGQATWG